MTIGQFFIRRMISMLSLNLLTQRSSSKPQAEWLLHIRSAEPGKGYGLRRIISPIGLIGTSIVSRASRNSRGGRGNQSPLEVADFG